RPPNIHHITPRYHQSSPKYHRTPQVTCRSSPSHPRATKFFISASHLIDMIDNQGQTNIRQIPQKVMNMKMRKICGADSQLNKRKVKQLQGNFFVYCVRSKTTYPTQK